MDSQAQVTLLLRNAKNGDKEALDQLIPIVYDELRRQAAHYLRRRASGRHAAANCLIHEAYIRLVDQETWNGKTAHISMASQRN